MSDTVPGPQDVVRSFIFFFSVVYELLLLLNEFITAVVV